MHHKVIACIDDSRYAEAVCDYAAWSAAHMQAPLSLLHVLDQLPEASRNLSGSIGLGEQESLLEELASLDEKRARVALEQGKVMLQAARARIATATLPERLPELETRQRHGGLLDALNDLADETRMLVVGKRGADTASAHGHIGSHLERIIRALQRPILIAQQSFTPPQQIMLAFDGSASTLKGVQMIADSPLFAGIPCHLVSVGPDTEEARAALTRARTILTDAGFNAPTALIPGEPETALVEYQEQNAIDLVVMGAYGHSRIRHFIVGSTTTAVLCKTRVSLMILR